MRLSKSFYSTSVLPKNDDELYCIVCENTDSNQCNNNIFLFAREGDTRALAHARNIKFTNDMRTFRYCDSFAAITFDYITYALDSLDFAKSRYRGRPPRMIGRWEQLRNGREREGEGARERDRDNRNRETCSIMSRWRI